MTFNHLSNNLPASLPLALAHMHSEFFPFLRCGTLKSNISLHNYCPVMQVSYAACITAACKNTSMQEASLA